MKVEKGFIRSSLVLLIAFGIFNVLNLLFQVSMARFLSISDYGILATLMSIIYFLAVFSESIQLVITKYTAEENNDGKIKNIFFKSLKKASIVSIGLFIVNLILTIFLSPVLNISYALLAFNGLVIFLVLLPPIGRGVMQGKKKFFSLGFNMVVEGVVKIVFSAGLVFLGFRVYGALIGILFGGGIALLFSFASLRKILSKKEEPSETKDIYGYSRPAFTCMLAILFFYSMDVIIAKSVFSDEVAGMYAIASVLAKSIFLGTQPVSKAMFSLTAEKNKEDKKSKNILFNAVGVILIISVCAISTFLIFPNHIISLFSGKNLESIEGSLVFLGLANSLIALTNLLVFYKLSSGKTKGNAFFLALSIIEIATIVVITNIIEMNLTEFSGLYLIASAIFFLLSILIIRRDN